MPISDQTKIDASFKILAGREFTSVGKQWYEEAASNAQTIHYDDVYTTQISSDPSAAITAGVAEYMSDLVLTKDATVGSSLGWIAYSVPGDASSSRITDFIPPSFGQGYTVRIFEDNGSGGIGNEILTTNATDWLFNYRRGVLVLQDAHTFQEPIHAKVYHYIGIKGAGAGSSPIRVKMFDFSATQDVAVIHDLGIRHPIVQAVIFDNNISSLPYGYAGYGLGLFGGYSEIDGLVGSQDGDGPDGSLFIRTVLNADNDKMTVYHLDSNSLGVRFNVPLTGRLIVHG